METNTVLGLGTSAVVIVPEAVEKASEVINVPVVHNPPPSFMTYDVTNGLYSYGFTIGDIITTIAIACTMTFATLALRKYFKGEEPKRRKDDE